jgi:hypothetical protein
MNALRKISDLTVSTVKGGHCGVFTSLDLGILLHEPVTINFKKYLYKVVKAGVLIKVARDLYYNPVAGVQSVGILERVAKLVHWNKFIYVSLETQLSYLGVISQVTMKRLTVMTTGKSRIVKTPFGTIEFTHTSRSLDSLESELYYDDEINIFRANGSRAISDLKRVGRNTDMLPHISDS